jgi:hypothetical protein
MGASIDDVAITIVSNGETAYYSSYKGVGNVLWEIECGLYSEDKPNAFTLFDSVKGKTWENAIDKLEKPLENPTYGILTVDFDNKTIVDENGYNSWDAMPLDWLVNCVFRFANRELQGWNMDTMLTKETFIKHLEDGNFYIGNRFNKDVDVSFPKNINDAYDFFASLGYDDYHNRPKSVIEKDYVWGKVKPPKGWEVINSKKLSNTTKKFK